jgi:hypothetical protein
MKHIIILSILLIFAQSCQKEDSQEMDINHFLDIVLEIDDRNNVGSNQSQIFNAYIYAIKLEPSGNFLILDDNYGQFDYWIDRGSTVPRKYNIKDQSIIFELSRNGEIIEHEWEIIEVKSDYIKYSETTKKGAFIHKISTSNKQEIR